MVQLPVPPEVTMATAPPPAPVTTELATLSVDPVGAVPPEVLTNAAVAGAVPDAWTPAAPEAPPAALPVAWPELPVMQMMFRAAETLRMEMVQLPVFPEVTIATAAPPVPVVASVATVGAAAPE